MGRIYSNSYRLLWRMRGYPSIHLIPNCQDYLQGGNAQLFFSCLTIFGSSTASCSTQSVPSVQIWLHRFLDNLLTFSLNFVSFCLNSRTQRASFDLTEERHGYSESILSFWKETGFFVRSWKDRRSLGAEGGAT